MRAPPRRRLAARSHRLIASRFPTIGVFDDLAETEDEVRAAFELEALTNDRLTAAERLRRIPGGDVPAGPGASLVMAAFLHADPAGGRFSDGRLGAWYAAMELATAIEETVFHHTRRLKASAAGFPNRIQMRELIVDLEVQVLDIRGQGTSRPDLYDPNDYAASQSWAHSRRWPFAAPGEDGVAFDSVRRPGGTNVCIWRPTAIPLPVLQGGHFEYVWDGKGELTVLSLTEVARGRG